MKALATVVSCLRGLIAAVMTFKQHIQHVNCRWLIVSACTIMVWVGVISLMSRGKRLPVTYVPIPLYTPDASIHRGIIPLDTSQWLSHPVLKRTLDRPNHAQLLGLLQDFIKLLNQSAIDVMITDDTLLGSYFFHDILPWDSNIHLMVNHADKQKLSNLFSRPEFHTKYNLLSNTSDTHKELQVGHAKSSTDMTFKIFQSTSQRDGKHSWDEPYMSVKYYKEQDDHIITLTTPDAPVPASIFFPTKRRPLGNQWVLAPANTRAFLQVKYGKFSCATIQAIMRRGDKATEVPCSEIVHYYPCIHRNWTDDGQAWETLMLHGEPIYTIRVSEPRQVIKGCYDLKMFYFH